MSKRLQVALDDAEMRRVRRAARVAGVTVSEWVRRALSASLEARPLSSVKRKLETIRAAVQYDFPAPDIERMNAEIAAGYAAGWEP